MTTPLAGLGSDAHSTTKIRIHIQENDEVVMAKNISLPCISTVTMHTLTSMFTYDTYM